MTSFEFNNLVVIITGAGGGLGRAYALEYAKRGAKVVVNDLGAPEPVVEEIKKLGGIAVADKHSCEQGDEIVMTALNAFGKIDILINNAGILRDASFHKMTPKQWQQVIDVHLNGTFKMTKACWDIFQKQKFGRIINTASAAGIYGNYGQANYSSAKLGLHGFTLSISKEGQRNNVYTNTIAPIAASKMTETVLPQEILANLKPEFVAPLVLYLSHPSTTENGSLFEVGAGYIAKLRWERSAGALFKLDNSFTPSAVLAKWNQIHDFSNPQFPQSMSDTNPLQYLELTKSVVNQVGPTIDLKDKVVVITGAGNGLGRQYALLFAKYKSKLVINDLGSSTHGDGKSSSAADAVVAECTALGAQAIPNYNNVIDGHLIIKSAIDHFGKIDILINNAGILRDASLSKMTHEDWSLIDKVHLYGTFATCHAAWPYFQSQKYGRIINTSSAIALYGNYGSSNYGAMKSAIIGLSNTLAIEGKSKNITVNCVVPTAGTRITGTILPQDIIDAMKPDYVAPFVIALTTTKESGKVYEVGCGYIGNVKWQRTKGYGFHTITPDAIASKWPVICDFTHFTNPQSVQDSYGEIFDNFKNLTTPSASSYPTINYEWEYTTKDAINYNLAVGATQLSLVYENHSDFTIIPTLMNSPIVIACGLYPIDKLVDNYSLMNLVHGEQVLKLKQPLLVDGEALALVGTTTGIEQKGKHVVMQLHVVGSSKRGVVIEGDIVVFIRHCTVKSGMTQMAIKSDKYEEPSGSPDTTVAYKTSLQAALLFRQASGDMNPLHVDVDFAGMGGFKQPILHGMCSMGVSGRLVQAQFGKFDFISGRLVREVYPGETLEVDMWRNGDKVKYRTRVGDRVVIGKGLVHLVGQIKKESASGQVLHKLGVYLSTLKKPLKGVVALELGNGEKWIVDLNDKIVKEGSGKSDVVVKMTETDFIKLAAGELDGQKAFMEGKLKASGNIMMTMTLGDLLKGARGKL